MARKAIDQVILHKLMMDWITGCQHHPDCPNLTCDDSLKQINPLTADAGVSYRTHEIGWL
jgi:hypothetical protein